MSQLERLADRWEAAADNADPQLGLPGSLIAGTWRRAASELRAVLDGIARTPEGETVTYHDEVTGQTAAFPVYAAPATTRFVQPISPQTREAEGAAPCFDGCAHFWEGNGHYPQAEGER